MQAMSEWWHQLTPMNQWFYGAAAFFTVFFLWQLIATIAGLAAGDHDLDTSAADHDLSAGHDVHAGDFHAGDVHAADAHGPAHGADAHDTLLAFKLLSVRSVLAFLTLFTWATALYLNAGQAAQGAMGYALLWGLAAMILVSMLVHGMRKLTETGNVRIETCVGHEAVVYLDIPADGVGEIRALCSGVYTHLKARCPDGPLKAGQIVRVLRTVGPSTVEVQAAPTSAAV